MEGGSERAGETRSGSCGGEGPRTSVGRLLIDRFRGGGAWVLGCAEAGRDGCCGFGWVEIPSPVNHFLPTRLAQRCSRWSRTIGAVGRLLVDQREGIYE